MQKFAWISQWWSKKKFKLIESMKSIKLMKLIKQNIFIVKIFTAKTIWQINELERMWANKTWKWCFFLLNASFLAFKPETSSFGWFHNFSWPNLDKQAIFQCLTMSFYSFFESLNIYLEWLWRKTLQLAIIKISTAGDGFCRNLRMII